MIRRSLTELDDDLQNISGVGAITTVSGETRFISDTFLKATTVALATTIAEVEAI